MPTPDVAPPVASSAEVPGLRLKRLFLRALIISLVCCALVAVIALLAAAFNETTGKILVTLGALAVHSGFAMLCAATLERGRRPRLSAAGLVLGALSFGVLMTCVWVPGWFDEPTIRALASTGALFAAYVLAVPGAALAEHVERGVLRTLGRAALFVTALAFLMTLVCTWAEPTDDDAFAKATAIMAIAAFSLAHTSLVTRAPRDEVLQRLKALAILALWAPALLAAGMIIIEPRDEAWFRVLGALGVLDATASLSLLIAAKLRQVGRVAELETTPALVELRCPRCLAPQTLAVGASQCTACGLKIRLDIEEPRCRKCNYVLWQLPERRCPECGTAF
jgi:hypothetical protein